MRLWRDIGGFNVINPGATVTWEIVYPPNGRDVGTVVASPNIIQPDAINRELVALEQGVVARQTSGEGGPAIHYSVKIRNLGTFPIVYNLNIGDWL
jgi:hypothetical protein